MFRLIFCITLVFVFSIGGIFSMTAEGNRRNCTPPCCDRSPTGIACVCLIETVSCSAVCVKECIKESGFRNLVECGHTASTFTGCLESGRKSRVGMAECCENTQDIFDLICDNLADVACNSADCLYKMRDENCEGYY